MAARLGEATGTPPAHVIAHVLRLGLDAQITADNDDDDGEGND